MDPEDTKRPQEGQDAGQAAIPTKAVGGVAAPGVQDPAAAPKLTPEEQMALFAKKDDPQSELKKIRLHDKVRALHLAGLQLKMFKEGRDLGLLDDLADLIRQARERSGAGAK